MPEFFLDLENRSRVLRFLIEYMPFASDEIRTQAKAIIEKNESDPSSVSEEELAAHARSLALNIWPMRFAIEQFLDEEPQKEWEIVVKAVRPETKAHLNKLKNEYSTNSLEEFLSNSEIDSILNEDEKLEIDSVRREARLVIRNDEESIKDIIPEGEDELDIYIEKFDQLRELASLLTGALQDEAFSKLRNYEDRILFEGENMAFEILDQEIAYYREQKELNPSES